MSLDPRFVLAPSLQDFIIDKNTGLPASGGLVFFYQDINRNNPKPVYELSGVPPYSTADYAPLPNPLTLSAVGTFQDNNGTDVIPYWFPYDGTPGPGMSEGNIDLYYIVVQNAAGTQLFTREAWPNITSSGSAPSDVEISNFAPNGQFLLHNAASSVVEQAPTFNYGTYTTFADQVAPGGYSVEVSSTSTAVDTITFPRFDQFVDSPDSSPRYYMEWVRSVASADAQADFRIKFKDVFKFASSNLPYTLLFWARSLSGVSNVNLFYINNYGTGGGLAGDQTVEIPITPNGGPLTFTGTWTQYAIQMANIPIPAGTVGNNDDDFMQFAIRMPTGGGQTFSVDFTNIMLSPGTLSQGATLFPATTNGEFIASALDNLAPTTTLAGKTYYSNDGSNLYLPIVMTQAGFTYDYSQIGRIVSTVYTAANASNYPLLLCDGSSYVASNTSALGVPYSRLQSMLLANSPVANIPLYGTGLDYATAYQISGNTATLRVTVNAAGSVSAINNGTTGWTTVSTRTGVSTTNYNAYNNIANTVLAIGNFVTPNAAAAAHTSGFTITTLNFATGLLAQDLYAFTVLCTTAAALSNTGGAGKYFTFSNASTNYYMWFFFTNETDPAPGGTGIKIDMSLMQSGTAQDVANVVREAINAWQISTIAVSGLPTAGQYFTFSAKPSAAVTYVVWYQVNGVGVAPGVSGTKVMVALSGSETNAQIVTKTLAAINAQQFAVPDFRGMFQRMLDTSGTWDLDTATRWSTVTGISGANLGTFEYDQFLGHVHNVTPTGTLTNAFASAASGNGAQLTSSTGATNTVGPFPLTLATVTSTTTGGSETRPVNAAVNFFIGY